MKSALATALGALGLGILLTIAGLRGPQPDAYQFPILIGGAMVLLGLFMVGEVLLRYRAEVVAAVEARSLPIGRLWPAAAVMLGYLLLIERLGFYSSAFLAFLALTTIYARRAPFDMRALLQRMLYGLLFIGVLYVLFALVLRAQLPRGILL